MAQPFENSVGLYVMVTNIVGTFYKCPFNEDDIVLNRKYLIVDFW